jgi:hypothetical protein
MQFIHQDMNCQEFSDFFVTSNDVFVLEKGDRGCVRTARGIPQSGRSIFEASPRCANVDDREGQGSDPKHASSILLTRLVSALLTRFHLRFRHAGWWRLGRRHFCGPVPNSLSLVVIPATSLFATSSFSIGHP